MASARSIQLNLDQGQTQTVQLGRDVQVRGLKEVDGVVYPRFTGLHFEDSSLPIVLPSTSTSTMIFRSTNLAASSIVSEDMQLVSETRAIMPFEGIYRFRLQVAYEIVSTNPGLILFGYRYENSQVVAVIPVRPQDTTIGKHILTVEDTFRAYGVRFDQVAPRGRDGSRILRNLAEDPALAAETYYELEYIGNI